MFGSELKYGDVFRTAPDSECCVVIDMTCSQIADLGEHIYAACDTKLLRFYPSQEVFLVSSRHGGLPNSQEIDYRLGGIRKELEKKMKTEAADEWLLSPNRHFGGKSPHEVIAEGNSEWVWQVILGASDKFV